MPDSQHRSTRSRATFLALLAAACLLAGAPTGAQSVTTERVSVGTGGAQSPQGAFPSTARVSADGRYVVFATLSQLVAADTNAFDDVYVYDRQTQTTTLVSVTSTGGSGNNWSRAGYISSDGRYVDFSSRATNMVPGAPTYTAEYLCDLQNPFPVMVSRSTAGAIANSTSCWGVVSDDGRYVAFESNATNLGGPGNLYTDVFRRDVTSSQTIPVSLTHMATAGNGPSFNSSMSADGRYIVFTSAATNLVPQSVGSYNDVYLRDTLTGTTSLVSQSTGNPGVPGNQRSFHGKISLNGRYVAFTSDATNLVPNDNNGVGDVFVRDLFTNTTSRVSLSSAGAEGNGSSGGNSGQHISRDGRYVAFVSAATNLVAGDTNGFDDIFVHDTLSATTLRASLSTLGAEPNANCQIPTVSDDGRSVCYGSNATNLVPNDTNGSYDVFVSRPGTSLDCVDGASEENGTFLFVENGQITTNVSRLEAGGDSRRGTVADGISQLLLRFNSDLPGTLTVSFVTMNADEGAIAVPGGAFGQAQLQIPLVQTTQGHQAFCVYRAPDDFVRQGVGGDLTSPSRQVVLNFSFLAQGSMTPIAFPFNIRIERPPVVFCHGLWSGPGTWQGPFAGLASGQDPRFRAIRADYSMTAAESFYDNARVTTDTISMAQSMVRNVDLACSRVDWVGHSMGGILPRFEFRLAERGLARRPWARPDNYETGDIHKIIILNSPQWGSPWANILVSLRQVAAFSSSMFNLGMPVGAAIDDLEEGSSSLLQIGTTPFRAHAIVSVGLEITVAQSISGLRGAAFLLSSPWSTFLAAATHFASVTVAQVYRGQRHDLIVLEASQEGGLPIANRTVLSDPLQTLHTSVTSWQTAYTTVVDRLNARMTAFSADMPPPNPNPPESVTPLPGFIVPPQVDGVEVVLLTGGNIQPGQQVQLEVRGKNGFVPVEADLMSPWVSQNSTTSPFQFTVTIPITAAGQVDFLAFGIDSGGANAVSLPFAVPIQIPATLQSVTPALHTVELYYPLQRFRQVINGFYSDQVTRNIARASAGTSYVSSSPSIVTVGPDGEIQALQEGQATITITNTGYAGSEDVTVNVVYGPVRQYGLPTEGAGGFWPLGSTGGEDPQVGNNNFKIQIDELTGGVQGAVHLSSAPDQIQVAGINVHIDLSNAPGVGVTANGTSGQPGVGTATLPLPIPNDPSLIGAVLYIQGYFIDGGSPFGVSASNGIVVTIQP